MLLLSQWVRGYLQNGFSCAGGKSSPCLKSSCGANVNSPRATMQAKNWLKPFMSILYILKGLILSLLGFPASLLDLELYNLKSRHLLKR